MKILVTGGAGYVGLQTVKALRQAGHEVLIFDNFSTGNRDLVRGERVQEGDLLDEQSIARVFSAEAFDCVMHFAAKALVGESVGRPLFYYEQNVKGSVNLVAAMLRAGVTSLIFSSTAATYGNAERMPISEEQQTLPVNPYGQTKLIVEQMLRDLSLTEGLRAVSLRYFNAAGADPSGNLGEKRAVETHLIPRILQEVVAARRINRPARVEVYGNDYPTPDGTCVRDYVHVCDLAEAHLLAMGCLAAGKPLSHFYNLGTAQGASVLEVIREAERVTGEKIVVDYQPRRPGDPATLVASHEKAKREIGWQPRQSSISEILESAWRWENK